MSENEDLDVDDILPLQFYLNDDQANIKGEHHDDDVQGVEMRQGEKGRLDE